MGYIGKPVREIQVEPLSLPVPSRQPASVPTPQETPQPQPVMVPA